MTAVISRREVNEAVADFLDPLGRPVGRARIPTQPTNDQIVADPPYMILYPIMGGTYWGAPLTSPEDSMGLVYQVTCVGMREDQAQWLADEVRVRILDRNTDGAFVSSLTVAGLNVIMREPEGPPSGPMQEGKIWQVVERYKITVSLH